MRMVEFTEYKSDNPVAINPHHVVSADIYNRPTEEEPAEPHVTQLILNHEAHSTILVNGAFVDVVELLRSEGRG